MERDVKQKNEGVIMSASQRELQKALNLIRENWGRQNNANDRRSNFIYQVQTVDECLRRAQVLGIDSNYVLHRWYNFHTSTKCEEIFVEHGAIKEQDPYNHDIDIYIDDIPYDVKLTVYPAKLENEGVFIDLNSRNGKNDLIQWFYSNQSQEGRKHLKNRIFIVCNGDTAFEKMAKKCDFETIDKAIRNYFNYLLSNAPNQLVIEDSGRQFEVYSEIINIY